MVNRIFFFLLVFPIIVFSQELGGLDPNKKLEEPNYFRPGLLKASATISPGRMIQNKANSIYISGFLEYILDKKYSLRGDVFQFVDAGYTDASLLEPNFINRLYFGAFRHFGKKNLKLYTGAQAGMTFIQYYHSFNQGRKFSVEPSFALKAGTTFYVWKYFHFFADLTYVNSTTRGLMFGSQKMDEVIFSAGLGFQINTKKKFKGPPPNPSF
ncbi:MAG: hypothetical protein ACKO7P_09270 [Bacteroidota bacterium]